MKKKGPLYALFLSLLFILPGCSSIAVLNPKGPAARTLSDTIILSIVVMAFVLAVVYILYIFVLVKYRAKKSNEGYIPEHEEGNKVLEAIWIIIPIIIVGFLSVVTVKSTHAVENVANEYKDQKPLVIYASSSNWKWHFSYPEEGIETVNYVNIPVHRAVEFRLYSFGTITSFWVPQLAGQKYAMSDMLTYLNLSGDTVGSYIGKNSNFSGKGFAHMEFETLVMTDKDYQDWVKEVKETAPALTEDEFKGLLAAEHLGRKTYSSTHLEFSPPPGDHSEHMSGDGMEMDMQNGGEEHEDNKEIHPSPAPSSQTEFDGNPAPEVEEPLPSSPVEEHTHQ
ncbi:MULTISPECIES: cytochrome aa3 quinol oxidase subunit II [unclassified Paenibacillus]|uniref:cytochrome aa3 quinol oxidase subunit II n=1 Tax=unclassified Paenibacillus TaxID=185978 RepID=UPI002404A36C|nr:MULTISPECIES: cytochrome aa3 quinol oxidase subunit II [unclassified Paenibacillus]MDF9842452.1 cytochrome aa3-600 menaquinol oxidase subunit 2 [Paenibacillus sp. PastF-2]MDF9849042.1 cytochrome aa3-600 menaquinol oxidase subunit 2 [Paenibacillus sp. PastM-2]MDF9855612.1 cytochrome aa3-600 menaquinol oxidase subunit 2 [Paenibacillus sp. PastF-1]MDH6480884.1 cytochrome aa3-600 menaquinol oxidase subunit 2 [Paenibacillus sp. PastH-2]MDH6508306.1 cytochrome aa3-600 menaquinol oxidase subunit 2